MAERLNYDSAKLFYVVHRDCVTEQTWPLFERCESLLLKTPIDSSDRAVTVLRVLLDQQGEARADGLDRKALKAVTAWVEGLAKVAEPPRARLAA